MKPFPLPLPKSHITACLILIATLPLLPACSGGGGSANFDPVRELTRFGEYRISNSEDNDDLKSVDLNNDGIEDLLTISDHGETLTIMLGQGTGQYKVDYRYNLDFDNTNRNAGIFSIKDMDNNGKFDVIIFYGNKNELVIFPGLGDGSFDISPITIDIPSHSTYIIGNVDNDKFLDILILDNSRSQLLLNLGDFKFAQTNIGQQPFGVPGDFNQDGQLDMIELPYMAAPVTSLGNGDGTFGSDVRLSTSSNIRDSNPWDSQWVVDVNNDGYPDIIDKIDGLIKCLTVWINNQDLTFTQKTTCLDNPEHFDFRLGIPGDLNGDGYIDIIIYETNASGGIVSAINDGSGQLVFQEKKSTFPIGSNGVLTDVNADGFPDFVIAQGTIAIMNGRGDGTFVSVADQSYPLDFFSSSLKVGDINNDGVVDFVGTGSDVSIYLGKVDGDFEFFNLYSPAPLNMSTVVIKLIDLTGDGDLDLITRHFKSFPQEPANEVIVVSKGLGDGTFVKMLTLTLPARDTKPILVDLNNDGELDLIAHTRESQTITVYFNLGKANFSDPTTIPLPIPYASLKYDDINSNGHIDMLTEFPMTVIFQGDDLSFEETTVLNIDSPPYFIGIPSYDLIDLNQDGLRDIITFTQGDLKHPQLTTAISNGDGTFQESQLHDSIIIPYHSFVLKDMNGDSIPDIIASNFSDVMIKYGLGDGQYRDAMYFPGYFFYQIADINGDNLNDLLTTAFDRFDVYVLRNQGP